MKVENAKTCSERDLKYQQGQSGPCVAAAKGLALQQREGTAAERTGCKVGVYPSGKSLATDGSTSKVPHAKSGLLPYMPRNMKDIEGGSTASERKQIQKDKRLS